MMTKETSETMSCLQRFLPPGQKPERIFTEKSKEFVKSVSRSMDSRHECASSLRNKRSGRKEPSAEKKKVQQSHSFKVAFLMNGGIVRMECNFYMRNLQVRMVDGHAAFEKRCGKTFERPVIPLWSTG